MARRRKHSAEQTTFNVVFRLYEVRSIWVNDDHSISDLGRFRKSKKPPVRLTQVARQIQPDLPQAETLNESDQRGKANSVITLSVNPVYSTPKGAWGQIRSPPSWPSWLLYHNLLPGLKPSVS